MSGVRPLEARDIPGVAALRERVFAHSRLGTREAVERRLVSVFLENPWRREDLPSLVYSTGSRPVAGFLGVVPRTLRVGGREIQAAVTGQFMVDPGERGLAGIALYRRAFEGEQELLYTDIPNETARIVWEGLGGHSALVYAVNWTRPLRPARDALRRWGTSPPIRILRFAARPLAHGLDGLAVRRSIRRLRDEDVRVRDHLDATQLCRLTDELGSRKRLRPLYEPRSLAWLLERARETWGPDRLRVAAVHRGGEPVGWFVCVVRRNGWSQVIQTGARSAHRGATFRALLAYCVEHGAVALRGRFERPFLNVAREEGCSFSFDHGGLLLHTADRDLHDEIVRGDAALSGLEGEWWMGF